MVDTALLNKYNKPIPRYTSYPTVPYWKNNIDIEQWQSVFIAQVNHANHGEGISLYLHLPFCESLCTYCGCNKKITTNHAEEDEYLEAILKEWQLYLNLMGEKPLIREIHIGGGTPTFFSPQNLAKLINTIKEESIIHPQHEFSIEGHPNNTTAEHLQTLFNLGFRRISYGVQDHDPEVQRVISRIQPFENVKRATELARAIGFLSVNFDLIYGLPLQKLTSMETTIQQTLALRPDRIAFYSYAHVPWVSRSQRLFDESHLPNPEEKMQLYQLGKKMLTENGYFDIGMDHFALPEDDLYLAWEEGKLHRNFMGYTTQKTSMLLGLGVSSISDAGNAFAQNDKTLHNYYQYINEGKMAVQKGYFLDEEDKAFKKYILEISCNGSTTLQAKNYSTLEEYSFPVLQELEKDKLIIWDHNTITVTPLGRNFIRNICSAFDIHLQRETVANKPGIFSNAI